MESASNSYQENESFPDNATDKVVKHYVESTAPFSLKLLVVTLLAVTALIGFVGNILVYRFARNRERLQRQQTRFAPRRFFLFIQSLALSDILTCAITIPLTCVDLFTKYAYIKWSCKIIRFFAQLFPIVTIYNLLVVSLERYLGVCHPTYCLSEATAKRLVKLAWAVGTVLTFFSTFTFEPIKRDVDDKHFTLRCKQHLDNTVSRTLGVTFTVFFYDLPIAFLIFTSASILRVIWRRTETQVARCSATNSQAHRKKATKLLLSVVVAFVVSCTPFQANLTYNVLANTDIDLPIEDYIRAAVGFLLYANSAVNVFIHLIQLPGFYKSLKTNSGPAR